MNMAVKRGHMEIVQSFMQEGVQVELDAPEQGKNEEQQAAETTTPETPDAETTKVDDES